MTTNATRIAEKQQLCRLCAETKERFIGIFDIEGQKLGINTKIAKCLQIQVFLSDYLPLFVCIDCCTLLNQCNEFYEKTNQAQCFLRKMIVDSKVNQETIRNIPAIIMESNINYVEKKISFIKENNYTNNSINIIEDNYIDNSNNFIEQIKLKKVTKDIKEKKSITRQNFINNNKKKNIKKKNDSFKINKKEFQDLMLDGLHNGQKIEKEKEPIIKIPDNYMTGRKNISDKIMKIKQKKGETIDKYPWLCTDCNDKLPSLEALELHHKIIHNQKAKYMCVQCYKIYEKYYGFLTHVKRHKTKTKFSCDDCGKTFIHKKVLDTHRAIHSEKRPYMCQTCGKGFRQQSALYIHSRCHLPENIKNRFPCDQCDKRFSTKPNLVTHKRIHSGVRNFTCDQCGKSFIQKGNLEAHFLTHSVVKPYNCSQCSKAFKTPLQLKKHETVHTGAKPHQCTVCGRTFREKGTLREHHRIHTGAMPFSCEFCGKCFRFKGILTTHRRQHTGERPYSCTECQHHFTNWPNYNKHMKRRHGINTSQSKNQLPRKDQKEAQKKLQNFQDQQSQHNFSKFHQQSLTRSGSQNTQLSLTSSNFTSVQVIQAIPHMTTQPLVLQTMPSNNSVTSIQAFAEETAVVGSEISIIQESIPEMSGLGERNNSATACFSSLSEPFSSFLPCNLPYNFCNVSNVIESDLIHNR